MSKTKWALGNGQPNILVAATKLKGIKMAEALMLDPKEWAVVGFGVSLMGLQFRRIVVCITRQEANEIGSSRVVDYVDSNLKSKLALENEGLHLIG